MTMYRCGGDGSRNDVSQIFRTDIFNGSTTRQYPSEYYGKRIFAACLSSHYGSGTKTTLTWSCDSGEITQIINEESANATKFEAVRYDGDGTLTMGRVTQSGSYYANVGLICSENYQNLAVAGLSHGGNSSCTIDVSDYGNDFILAGIQLDYQRTSKVTVTTSDSDVIIIPYMPTLSIYNQGASTCYRIKSNGTGTLSVSWTANSNDKLGGTRILVIY